MNKLLLKRTPLKTAILSVLMFLFIIVFSSCEKEVHIDLGSVPPQLVVEGGIQQGLPPVVVLTTTISFFSSIDYSTLQNSFVHTADVTVSDGITTIKLKEYSLDTGNHNKFYLYSIDTPYTFKGQIGKTYFLTINYNGKTYTSNTTIPPPMQLDSFSIVAPPVPSVKFPNAVTLYLHFKDPDTLGNYAKYYTKRNSEPYYSSSIYTDELNNGTAVSWYIDPGANLAMPDSSSTRRFYKGDTVAVKWCSIDRNVYKFWNTYEFAQNSIGNPFATPINAQSNISNGALGVWQGYGADTIAIIIPK